MKARHCAWVSEERVASTKAVWARGEVFSVQCPKSVITAQSLHFLEQFRLWKEFGRGSLWSMEAKSAEAIFVLERAWRMENERGEL